MSAFEPTVVMSIIKNSAAVPLKEKKEFEVKWKAAVDARVKSWVKHRSSGARNQPNFVPQLEWEAHIVEYVAFIYKLTKCHGNSKKDVPKSLPRDIPLLGPHFTPPSYFHVQKRQTTPIIQAQTAYLKPLNIVHPFYYANLDKCPQCGATDTRWDGWTTTGHRRVHGVHEEETALGYQLICKTCENQYSHAKGSTGTDEGTFCFATTNPIFWVKWEHWAIPRGIPHFSKRCAVTQDLFNLIIELRPSLTSMGLAENIMQLHLLEYKRRELEYLQNFGDHRISPFMRNSLMKFSNPNDVDGYDDDPITDDLITDVFLGFSDHTRQAESEEYMRTLTGSCLSLDNTFRVARKATIIDKQKKRTKIMKGGVLSMINEISETLGWRMCQSCSADEMTEILEGYMRRCEELGIPSPEMVVVDNCCHVREAILKPMPKTHVVLDVYHFLMRYLNVIVNGAKNPNQSAVAKDITDAILETRAGKGASAVYRSKDEQESYLSAAFTKWSVHGGVWSAAASKTHAEQLHHVQKGCLARTRQDISSDGSRIEGSHKGWNSIQRSFASGLEVFNALAHDHVHRRNIRIGSSQKKSAPFISSTFGSHHVHLVHHVATIWNSMLKSEKILTTNLILLPELRTVNSNENFGIVKSRYMETFGGLLEIKIEDKYDVFDNIPLDEDQGVIELERQREALKWHTTKDNSEFFNHQPEGDVAIEEAIDGEDTGNHVLDLALIQGTTGMGSLMSESTMQMTSIKTITQDRTDNTVDITPQPTPKRKLDQVSATSTQVDNIPKKPRTLFNPNQKVQPSNGGISSLDKFFRFQHPSAVSPTTAPAKSCNSTASLKTTDQSLAAIRLPLKLPDSRKLTRSERLFSVATQSDPRAMTIKDSDEFHLFMDMRAENGWASFNMTSRKWVMATNDYNIRLEALNLSKNCATIKKNPRALLDLLGEIEPKISNRIMKNDFMSKRGGTETFWRKHCAAVPLVKTEHVNTNSGKVRRAATCSRCRTIMYPGPTGSPENHKKGYCSDGFKQVMKSDIVPDWPQPQGIFEFGTTFHPLQFLAAIRNVYEKVIIEGSSGGNLSMEYEAFGTLLTRRTIFPDGQVLFKLFELEMPSSTPPELIVEYNGARYLKIDCLRDGNSD